MRTTEARAEYAGALVIEWRNADRPNDPVSTTRLALPHIHVPAAPDVQVTVQAPAHATLSAPVYADVCIHNASDTDPADVVVDVRPTPDVDVSGPQHMHVTMLLPQEERHVRLELWPRHAGALAMPTVSAHTRGEHRADVRVHTTPNVLCAT